jgi:hypothetical protein
VSGNFKAIIICDFEYEVATGDLPDPLCMVAYVLDENCQRVRTVRLWRGEFGHEAPFDTGPDALFVAYSAWAEMTCFKVLSWKFPKYIFDQHTAHLAERIRYRFGIRAERQRPTWLVAAHHALDHAVAVAYGTGGLGATGRDGVVGRRPGTLRGRSA